VRHNARFPSIGGHRNSVEFTRFVRRWIVEFFGSSVEARKAQTCIVALATLLRMSARSARSPARSIRRSAVVIGRPSREQEVVASGPSCAAREPGRRSATSQMRVPGLPTVCGLAPRARSCSLGQRSSTLRAMKRRASEPMGPIRNVAGNAPHSGRASNPSIEGTCNIWLRQLSPAPHVKR